MHTRSRFFDDLARLATAAAGTAAGVRDEVETRVRDRLERTLSDLDVVPREEFEVVKAMAETARRENEALEARIVALEAKLGAG